MQVSSSFFVYGKIETGSPKQKSWKIFVTQQFKKIQKASIEFAEREDQPEWDGRKNLAIVFGPTIVRNLNLETAVKHMKHQCCIVES
jgi:hypothetical protein